MRKINLVVGMWVTLTEYPDQIFVLVEYDYNYSVWLLGSALLNDTTEKVSPAELITPYWLQPEIDLKLTDHIVYTIDSKLTMTKENGLCVQLIDEYGVWGTAPIEELLETTYKN